VTYQAGFVGSLTDEAIEWVQSVTGDAKSICIPFTGVGKALVSFASEDRTIESWDTLHYSRAIVEGVFASKEAKTNVDKIHYRKGWMYETRALKHIDERCAGFIDWVADEGTLFDKAALGSAIVRSTLMGRMGQWRSNMEQFWKRFQRIRAYNAEWISQRGTFAHHEGNVYDDLPNDKSYDLIHIDPPKIVVGTDIYSTQFAALNRALHGKVAELPEWTSRDSLAKFETLLGVNTKRVLFMYTSDVKPAYEEVRELLLRHGEVEVERKFPHRKRTDFGIVLRKS
jgi:hypothetical protein